MITYGSLLSDAQVPCTACVKSYTYALKTHPTTAGPAPDCLYDDPNEVAEGSNAKYQKLEEKINRLEALLKEQQGPSRIADQNAAFSYTVNDSENAFGYSSRISNASSPPTLFPSPMLSDVPPVLPSNTTQAINDLFAIIEPTSSMPIPSPGTSTGMFSQIVLEPNTLFLQLIDPSWPDNLPSPELLNHLIDTFFNCVPHATRVLHRPTFMSAMINHPSSPNFPHTAVLHAICAVASLYTPMITDQPENERIIAAAVPSFYSGVIPRAKPQLQTNGIYRKPGLEPIDNDRLSFGLLHARLAAQTFLRHVQSGYRMVELLQGIEF
ncbi:hypothetical protein FRC03_003641 [Tulasnella sp. 419]|nr:hypothetical protein FRC03_003641 [Tulasnella sp. 419]